MAPLPRLESSGFTPVRVQRAGVAVLSDWGGGEAGFQVGAGQAGAGEVAGAAGGLA